MTCTGQYLVSPLFTSMIAFITDVWRGASGMSSDVPIFVQFHEKIPNLYTLVVKNPKFVHFGGKKPKIRTIFCKKPTISFTLVGGDALLSPTAVHPCVQLLNF